MARVLYLTSIPVFIRKSASKITSYLQVLDSIQVLFVDQHCDFYQALVILYYVLLPSLMCCMFIILMCDVLHVLQFLSKHFLLINVVVEPESNRTFSNLLDLIADIVSTTIIVIGARLV